MSPYDTWGRVHTKVTKNSSGASVLTEEYTYVKPTINGVTVESSQIATYKVTGGSKITAYDYTYDGNGNILSVTEEQRNLNNEVEAICITTYVYDSANQLIRENNQAANYTHTWQYDAGGNILNRKEYAHTTGSLDGVTPTKTVTYGYDDVWGDMLTSYDGQTITRDEIGNPLSDGELTYEWERGRQLASTTKNGTTREYTYDANGMRIKKGVAGGTTPTSYVYNGSQLVRMEVNGNILDFTYDPAGKPLTLTYNGTVYYYETNLQGDVVGIRDANGTRKVTYTYDAWGNLLNYSGDVVLYTLNPLRYRGYVYDQDTGLYYVSSRYYNPEIGRFINADTTDVLTATPMGLTDKNLFAYCDNNPVMRADHGGEFWHLVVGGAIGGIIGGVSAAISGGDAVDVLIGVVAGAAGGILAATGAGVVAQAVGSAAISMTTNAITQARNISKGKQSKFDVGDMLFDGTVGLAAGAWGGNGASYGNSGGIMKAGTQLLKRGLFNAQARSHYAKVAHRMGGEFVLKPLLESLGKNAVGSAVVTGKNAIASKGLRLPSWLR